MMKKSIISSGIFAPPSSNVPRIENVGINRGGVLRVFQFLLFLFDKLARLVCFLDKAVDICDEIAVFFYAVKVDARRASAFVIPA